MLVVFVVTFGDEQDPIAPLKLIPAFLALSVERSMDRLLTDRLGDPRELFVVPTTMPHRVLRAQGRSLFPVGDHSFYHDVALWK